MSSYQFLNESQHVFFIDSFHLFHLLMVETLSASNMIKENSTAFIPFPNNLEIFSDNNYFRNT